MHSATTDTTSRIRLSRDHATLFHAERGTVIVSERCDIAVSETAAYLPDVATRARLLICQGECHVVKRSGWIQLQASGADSGVALIIVSTHLLSPSVWQRLRRRVTALMPLQG